MIQILLLHAYTASVVALKFGEEWGDGLPSWVGVFTGVVYGEVSEKVGRLLANVFGLR